MVFLNRATRRVLKPTRVRLHSAVAGVAFALLAGLSAPAAAASIGTNNATDTGTTTVAASTASTTKTAGTTKAAAKTADAAAWKPSTNDLHTAPVSGDQQSLNPTKEQLANAKAIMDAG